MIHAQMIEDSISLESQSEPRISTLLLRYPRFIHAELMTHRVFSRNASSSRAIPVDKLIADMRKQPAMPEFWGSNKPGMQAGDELPGVDIDLCKTIWLDSMNSAIKSAEQLRAVGLHKQIANRILEPWSHINVVVTSTEWDNFWDLRVHPDAQPEMRILAEKMAAEFDRSTPIRLNPGEWHLPFVNEDDRSRFSIEDLRKISTARCARTSYMTHDQKVPEAHKDIALHDKLVGSKPIHASPTEHQATPDEWYDFERPTCWAQEELHGNFNGWIQYRKMVENGIS